MKIAVLLFITVVIIFFFRFINKKNDKSILKDKDENIVDLEKDPEKDEYRPKE